jgi:cytochrome c oxidase accessory protein FixG
MTTEGKARAGRRIRPWRRAAEAAQAVVMLGLPFLRIHGESALRFDVPTLRLHAFGATVWMDDLFVGLAGVLFLLFAFLLVTLLFGRIWCGWGCPQTALVDLTGFLVAARRKGGAWRAAGYLAVAFVSVTVAADLLWYFVPPQEFFRSVLELSLGPVVLGTWVVTSAVIFADLALWRQRFCATTCPYAKFQGALLDAHSMSIAYDRRRDADCVECKACVRACPVGIDIRDGLQAECTSCGECIDACAPIMARLARPPRLIAHFFGAPGAPRRLLRPGVVALAVLTAASLGLTVATAAGRSDLEMTVTTSAARPPLRSSPRESRHFVAIALENRGREPLDVALTLGGAGIDADVRPGSVSLAAGGHRRIQTVVTVRWEGGAREVMAELSATGSRGGAPLAVRRALALTRPEEER